MGFVRAILDIFAHTHTNKHANTHSTGTHYTERQTDTHLQWCQFTLVRVKTNNNTLHTIHPVHNHQY